MVKYLALAPIQFMTNKKKDISYEHTLKLDGVNGFVFRVEDNGNKITVAGWMDDHWKFKAGERVLLVSKDKSEARYKIAEVRSMRDPRDQYFMDCTFDPRENL